MKLYFAICEKNFTSLRCFFQKAFKRFNKDTRGTKFRSGGFKNRSQINILRHSLFISINVVIRNNFHRLLTKILTKGDDLPANYRGGINGEPISSPIPRDRVVRYRDQATLHLSATANN